VRRCYDNAIVEALHHFIFPYDEYKETPDKLNVYWQVRTVGRHMNFPVAFASARCCEPGVVFLSSCGVLPSARGFRLQRRLIRARIAWARSHGYERAITYTTWDNVPSARNLLREGFELYTPSWWWADTGCLYFTRAL